MVGYVPSPPNSQRRDAHSLLLRLLHVVPRPQGGRGWPRLFPGSRLSDHWPPHLCPPFLEMQHSSLIIYLPGKYAECVRRRWVESLGENILKEKISLASIKGDVCQVLYIAPKPGSKRSSKDILVVAQEHSVSFQIYPHSPPLITPRTAFAQNMFEMARCLLLCIPCGFDPQPMPLCH